MVKNSHRLEFHKPKSLHIGLLELLSHPLPYSYTKSFLFHLNDTSDYKEWAFICCLCRLVKGVSFVKATFCLNRKSKVEMVNLRDACSSWRQACNCYTILGNATHRHVTFTDIQKTHIEVVLILHTYVNLYQLVWVETRVLKSLVMTIFTQEAVQVHSI